MELAKIKELMRENATLIFQELGMECECFGDNIYSTCPIHDGSDNRRAFSYSAKRGMWKCWTRDCHQEYNSDLFGLIRGVLSKRENKELEFKDALSWVCDLLKIQRSRRSTKSKQPVYDKDSDFYNVVDILSDTSPPYEHKPFTIDCKLKTPSQYFIGRKFKEETLSYFEVGECQQNGSILNNRAIIPIHDDTGEDIVGLIARATNKFMEPKFLLHPKSFEKRFFFYNYHRAIDKAKETSCLYLVEGQGDVWRLYEAGVHNAVGMFGKTISSEQESKLLKLPLTTLVILTDNDQAGREAKVQIKRQLGRSFRLIFPKLQGKLDVGDMSVNQINDKILCNLKGTF